MKNTFKRFAATASVLMLLAGTPVLTGCGNKAAKASSSPAATEKATTKDSGSSKTTTKTTTKSSTKSSTTA